MTSCRAWCILTWMSSCHRLAGAHSCKLAASSAPLRSAVVRRSVAKNSVRPRFFTRGDGDLSVGECADCGVLLLSVPDARQMSSAISSVDMFALTEVMKGTVVVKGSDVIDLDLSTAAILDKTVRGYRAANPGFRIVR